MSTLFDTELRNLYREQMIASEAERIVGDLWASSDLDSPEELLLKRVWDYLGDRREIAFTFLEISAGAVTSK